MKKNSILMILFGFITALSINADTFRSGIFLHHSTGQIIWGPGGSKTGIPAEMKNYCNLNGLQGKDTLSLKEQWWPPDPLDNEWSRWHYIFENRDTSADIRPFLKDNKILIIKSCYPSSDLNGAGVPSDTLYPEEKTIYNYKWHWRSIVRQMSRHPENFFVIWTNTPLIPRLTDSIKAHNSDIFCRWAKDTLSAGLDKETGKFPTNIYVFDFFHKLANSSGMLDIKYSQDSADSHPNSAAAGLVAPQFVREAFDAALAYEKGGSGVFEKKLSIVQGFSLENYPNPFNLFTRFRCRLPYDCNLSIKLYDLLGRLMGVLAEGRKQKGTLEMDLNSKGWASGVYYSVLSAGGFYLTRKIILSK